MELSYTGVACDTHPDCLSLRQVHGPPAGTRQLKPFHGPKTAIGSMPYQSSTCQFRNLGSVVAEQWILLPGPVFAIMLRQELQNGVANLLDEIDRHGSNPLKNARHSS